MTGAALASALALSLALAISARPAVAQTPRGVAVPDCSTTAADALDTDADWLSDACEAGLAAAFAPELVVRAGGCNWDDAAQPARLGGGYLYAVQRTAGVDGRIRVAYMPAYYRDCGWRGIKCRLPFVKCDPHAGDSELIVVEVEGDAGGYVVTGVFLSAHCFGRSRGGCRWFRGAELDAFEWSAGAPTAAVVWVSEGRQANYPSARACNRGHYTLDSCDDHDTRYRFPVHSPLQNVGSAARPTHPRGCVAGRSIWRSASEDPERRECVWADSSRFRGWQAGGAGVTGYARYLREIAAFH